MKTINFKEQYRQISNLVNGDIEKINEKIFALIDVEEPLKSALKDFLSAPSKKIRPTLGLLFLKCQNIAVEEKHHVFLSAIELIHNASLVHDDVIDEDKARRNQQSLNDKLGNKLAVILGDLLLSKAMQQICELGSGKIIRVLSDTLEQMCLGEINQQQTKFKIPTLEEYLKKSEQKTASLFDTTIRGCQILSEKTESDLGKHFGLAFQIKNDLTNVVSSENSDINQGIYTAPVILSKNPNDLSTGVEETKKLINTHINKALETIECLEDNEYKRAIIELLGLYKHEY